jgi:N-acetylneuraminic acid mutarotase
MKLIATLLILSCILTSCSKGGSENNAPNPPPLPIPSITSVNPSTGSAGLFITINGKNFSSTLTDNQVKFNGMDAQVVEADSIHILAKIPAGATTGKITVTLYGKTATSENDFIIYPGIWTDKGIFPGEGRISAVGFSLNGAGYIVTGETYPQSYKNDVWQYQPQTGWVKKADFPGLGRASTLAFTIGSQAYIGGGYTDYPTGAINDFWKYNATLDQWTPIAPFPGKPRKWAVSFSANGKGYVGLGMNYNQDTTRNDFWEYNPLTDQWREVAPYPGDGRFRAVAFSVADKGYVGLGAKSSSEFAKDFFQYDPATNQWNKKADYPASARIGSIGLNYSDKGLVGFGADNTGRKDFYQYNPSTNQWLRLADCHGIERSGTAGFSIGNKIFISGGMNAYPKDFWELEIP